MLFDEITASSLVKVDAAGNKLVGEPVPGQPGGVRHPQRDPRGARTTRCACCTRTRVAGVAVSAQKEGLLPISQQATVALASLGYHDYEGIALRDDEKPRLLRDLGDNSCLILRNHGLLTVGGTVADAFLLHVHPAARLRRFSSRAQAGGAQLIPVDPRIVAGVKANVVAVTRGLGGALAWPGLLRKLDRHNPGYAD